MPSTTSQSGGCTGNRSGSASSAKHRGMLQLVRIFRHGTHVLLCSKLLIVIGIACVKRFLLKRLIYHYWKSVK